MSCAIYKSWTFLISYLSRRILRLSKAHWILTKNLLMKERNTFLNEYDDEAMRVQFKHNDYHQASSNPLQALVMNFTISFCSYIHTVYPIMSTWHFGTSLSNIVPFGLFCSIDISFWVGIYNNTIIQLAIKCQQRRKYFVLTCMEPSYMYYIVYTMNGRELNSN